MEGGIEMMLGLLVVGRSVVFNRRTFGDFPVLSTSSSG